MIKLLDGIERLGEEVQCEECDSIVHCEEDDWEYVTYWLRNKQRKNQSIDCPKCFCRIYRWKDND